MENLEVRFSLPSSSMSSMAQTSSNQHPLFVDTEVWALAEQRTEEILGTFQPTVVSQRKRKEVIEYLAQLINGYFRLEVSYHLISIIVAEHVLYDWEFSFLIQLRVSLFPVYQSKPKFLRLLLDMEVVELLS